MGSERVEAFEKNINLACQQYTNKSLKKVVAFVSLLHQIRPLVNLTMSCMASVREEACDKSINLACEQYTSKSLKKLFK